MLEPLPPTFATTREALHALACYAIAPARKAVDGHIGLRASAGGFATPPLPDGTVIQVRHDRLVREPAIDEPITTIRAACNVLGIEPSPDPGVGTDLPPFAPDESLAVDPLAAAALGSWYLFVDDVLREAATRLGPASQAQLWPEHFDLACDWGRDDVARLNLGGSPGDGFSAVPYLYAGPWQREILAAGDPFWNAPFGAVVTYDELLAVADPLARGVDLLVEAAEHLQP